MLNQCAQSVPLEATLYVGWERSKYWKKSHFHHWTRGDDENIANFQGVLRTVNQDCRCLDTKIIQIQILSHCAPIRHLPLQSWHDTVCDFLCEICTARICVTVMVQSDSRISLPQSYDTVWIHKYRIKNNQISAERHTPFQGSQSTGQRWCWQWIHHAHSSTTGMLRWSKSVFSFFIHMYNAFSNIST